MSITFDIKQTVKENEINSKEFKINDFLRHQTELLFPIEKPEAIYKKLTESGCDEEKAIEMVEKIQIDNQVKRLKKINKRLESNKLVKSSCTTDYDDNELKIILNNKINSSNSGTTVTSLSAASLNEFNGSSLSIGSGNGSISGKEATVLCDGNNSFVYSAWRAYSQHHHLVIRPDNIWMAIMTQFSIYVNKNTKSLKDRFIDFDTSRFVDPNHHSNHHHHHKKEIHIKTDYPMMEASFDKLTNDIAEQICSNFKDYSIKDWIIPKFTTTTPTDKLVFSISLFSHTLKDFFHYKTQSNNGLPRVTLLGTIEDWKNLKDRVTRMADFDFEGSHQMSTWVSYLLPIMDKFIDSVNGNPDINWWNRMVDHRQQSSSSVLSGWLSVFCIFKEDGTFRYINETINAGSTSNNNSNNNSFNNLTNINNNTAHGNNVSGNNLSNISAGSFANIVNNSVVNTSSGSLNSSGDSFKSSGSSNNWPKISDCKFSNDILTTNILLTDFDGTKFHSELYAGCFGVKVEDNTKVVPSLDWFIIMENNHSKHKCSIN